MYYDRRRKFVLAGLLLVLVAALLAGGWWMLKKPVPGIYGAIALSEGSQRFGAAWGYHDPKAAAERARQECDKTGLADCAARVALEGTCGSLVMSVQTKQTFAVTDLDKAGAGALALAQCQATGATDCAVQANFCGNGG